jgi:two-component system sensor histidine kinase CssS
MKKLKFKSLTMRIWVTFTVILLIIVSSISFLYLFAYTTINENAKIKDLKVAHDIVLTSDNYNQPVRFGELDNLKGLDHFIYQVKENNISRLQDIGKGFPPPPDAKHILKPNPDGDDFDGAKKWMISFISSDTVSEKQFKESYKNKKYIFIISKVKEEKYGEAYLVSYVPEFNDNNLLYTILVVGIVFIAIGFITAKIVASKIAKPLKELEDFTVTIANKQWDKSIQIDSEDEIGRLAISMNRMKNQLMHADEEEKMFLQSISHDLKTPVMVIMGHAAAIVDGIYVESVERTAEIIKDEAIALEKKIKQILYLNTLDYVMENEKENLEFNLKELLLKIVSRFKLLNTKIKWEVSLDEVYTFGNIEKLQVAIENILDNALRYAENRITIKLKKEESSSSLEIYNDGVNISSKNIAYIFDNHYKDKTGNFGLGLAICKKIIDFHSAKVVALNREKGVSFIISFNK